MNIDDKALEEAFDRIGKENEGVSEETTETTETTEMPDLWKPSSWKDEELQSWETVPEHVRKAVERREREINKFMEDTAPRRKLAETFEQTTSRYADFLTQAGIDPMAAYNESLQLYSILRSGDENAKRQAINHIAKYHGINLDAKEEPSDPITSAIRQELQGIKSEIGSWKQAQAEAQQLEASSAIERFSKGKEHFDQVRFQMGQLIEAGLADSLDTAYEQALKLNNLSAKKEIDAKKKAASVNIDPKGAAAAGTKKPKNWMEGLEATYDEVVNN